MRRVTIGYGLFLVALGVGGFFITGRKSKTALIPAAFGAVALGLGRMHRRRRALWLGAALSSAALAGTAKALRKLPALWQGGEVERPAAVVSQALTAASSALHLTLSIGALLRKS